jgi:hypothetical protein
MKKLLSLMAMALSFTAFAGSEHDHKPITVSPEFETLKTLVGTWEGKTNMNGKEETIKTTYSLTSGGTALVETLNPGTPMEMVTIYSNNGKTTRAVHYCALGNQPEMKLKEAKNNTVSFELDGSKGITNKKEMHMHSVSLTVDGKKLKSEWTNFKDGKKDGTHTFELTKK